MLIPKWYKDPKNLLVAGIIVLILVLAVKKMCFSADEYERAVVSEYQVSVITTTVGEEKIYTYEESCANLEAAVNAKAALIDSFNNSIAARTAELGRGGNDAYIQGLIDSATEKQNNVNLPAAEALIQFWTDTRKFAEQNNACAATPPPPKAEQIEK